MRFARGRLIMHRNVRRGRIGWVRPVRVVADDERGLLLWLARDTPIVNEVDAFGRGIRSVPFTDWAGSGGFGLKAGAWHGPPLLKFLPAGAAHSVWFFRDPLTDRFASWYVNLEEPGVRWDDGPVAGIDIVDQDLDVFVHADRSWSWKDEDEFAERLARPGDYWVPDPDAVRAEGERVIKEVEAGVFPFDGTWCDFTPDPGWLDPPSLPPGWDRPPVR